MKGIHNGDLVVTEDRDISGIVKGDIVVRAPASVRVSGMIAGNVHIEPGASALISGMVKGNVSGNAIVTGMVAA